MPRAVACPRDTVTQPVGCPLSVSPAGAVLFGGLSPWPSSLVPHVVGVVVETWTGRGRCWVVDVPRAEGSGGALAGRAVSGGLISEFPGNLQGLLSVNSQDFPR